jgi:hypothetical protein
MSGTYKLDGALFERNPLTKTWRREKIAVHGTNEPIFADFWRLEMSFGWLTSETEMNSPTTSPQDRGINRLYRDLRR